MMAFSKEDRAKGVTSAELISCAPAKSDAELREAAEKLVEAYEAEFESPEGPGEDDRNLPDSDGLIYRDDGDPVAVSAWFTHGHFRRLRAALQREGNSDG